MKRNVLVMAGGLTSHLHTIGQLEEFRPRRIMIAGVRFNTGGDPKPDTLAGGSGDPAKAEPKAGDPPPADDKAKAGDPPVADPKAAEQTDEQKATAAAAAKALEDAGKDGKGKAGDKPKAPAEYKLTVPDGAADIIRPVVLKAIEDIARANDWTNEEAQAELLARTELAAAEGRARAEEYLTVTKADPEFGGDKLEATTKLARTAVDRVFPEGHKHREGFLNLLNRSGVGNKIEVVAFLATIGKQMAEDAPNLGGGKVNTEEVKATADVLFPSSSPKA